MAINTTLPDLPATRAVCSAMTSPTRRCSATSCWGALNSLQYIQIAEAPIAITAPARSNMFFVLEVILSFLGLIGWLWLNRKAPLHVGVHHLLAHAGKSKG